MLHESKDITAIVFAKTQPSASSNEPSLKRYDELRQSNNGQ